MDGDNVDVDRSALKRKHDETEPDFVQPGTTEQSDNIDLNLPDPTLSEAPVVNPMGELDLPDPEVPSIDDADQEMNEPVDQPSAVSAEASDVEATQPVISDTPLPDLGEPEAETPAIAPFSEPDAVSPPPTSEAANPVPTSEPLTLPSLESSVTDSSNVGQTECSNLQSLEVSSPLKNIPTSSTDDLKAVETKPEIPMSVGPSDEALISECEKLLEENREFEKSQMDHGPSNFDQDQDDQHSSDTVSVDSDTAKAQEEDFKNEPMDLDPPKAEPVTPQKPEDPLSTLASAALSIKPTNIPKNGKDTKKKNASNWCDVGLFNTSACVVTGFYATSDSNEYADLSTNNIPSFENMTKMCLEPGTAYKFRVCAVNSCGRGPWSEVSAFRTCLPGFPGAPSSIKISKSPDGANISWMPPNSSSGEIIEYSVCLAIKKYNHRNEEIKPNPAALTFEKVYSGPSSSAVVSHAALSNAYVDTTNKPAIIFRIAAKNEKGYGPATQVRWLQDVYIPKK